MSVSCILHGQNNSGIKLENQKFIQEFEDVTQEVKSVVGVDVLKQNIDEHIVDKENPHKVTAEQIGAAKESEVGNLYLWERQEKNILIDKEEYVIIWNGTEALYIDQELNEDGSFNTDFILTASNYENFLNAFVYMDTPFYFYQESDSDTIYYFDGDMEHINPNNDAPQMTITGYKVEIRTAHGDIEYVTDSDKSAYPEDGEQDGYKYVLKGQIGELGDSGDYYTKEETLTDTTAAQFGLDENATPDDVLSWLGKYNEHWWKVRTYSDNGAYVLQKSEKSHYANYFYLTQGYTETSQRTLEYSDNVICNPSTGEVSMVNPATMTTTGSNHSLSNYSTLRGMYVKNSYDKPGEIVVVPPSSNTYTLEEKKSSGGEYSYRFYLTNMTYWAMTSVWQSDIVVGEWQYLHSPDENAYPKSGISNKMEYQYLGVPFEKFPTMPQIETGSYTGTGKYGSSNPNSLTFAFTPKTLFVFSGIEAVGANGFGWVNGMTEGVPMNYVHSSSYLYKLTISSDGNTVTWYSSDSIDCQFNASSRKYYYIAFG